MTDIEFSEAVGIAQVILHGTPLPATFTKQRVERAMAQYGAWSDDWTAMFDYEKARIVRRVLEP